MADSSSPSHANPPGWAALGVLAVAAVVRAGVLLAGAETLNADPDAYRALATNLVETGTFGLVDQPGDAVRPTAYRPPLYPLLLAPSAAWPDGFVIGVGLLHWLAGVATTAVVLRLGRRLSLGWAGPIAGLLVAVDPILLHQSRLVMTETAATFLAALGWLALVAYLHQPGVARAAWCGAVLALAALCRPGLLVWAGCAALLFTTPSGSPAARGGRLLAFLLAGLVVVSPWVVRNWIQGGQPIATTTHGGYTLLLGNNESFYAYLREGNLRQPWQATPESLPINRQRMFDEIASGTQAIGAERAHDRRLYHQAWTTIRTDPSGFVHASAARIGRLWQLAPRAVPQDAPGAGRSVVARRLIGTWYAGVYLMVLAGMWRLGRGLLSPAWLGGLLLVASLTLVHTFYWSNMRMRAPLVPAISLLAGAGVCEVVRLFNWRKRCS